VTGGVPVEEARACDRLAFPTADRPRSRSATDHNSHKSPKTAAARAEAVGQANLIHRHWPGGDGALPEYHRASAVQQDAVLGVPPYRAGERDPLGVAADRRQVCRAAGVIDPGHFLLDDLPLV
jgi:hypothetical protein